MTQPTRTSAAGLVPGGRRSATPLARVCGLCLALVAIGCYNTVPLATSPQPGTRVVLQLSDRGRVGMDSAIGPGADRIEGVLESTDGSAYAVSVSSVSYLSGQSNIWNGERVTVPVEHVSRAWEREYSRERTLLAAAGIAGGVAAIILSTDLFGGGREQVEGPPNGEPVEQ